MSLQGAINAFNKKVQDVASDEFRARCVALTNDAIRNTPVDTGRLRANWQATVNRRPVEQVDSLTPPAVSIPKLKHTDEFYLTNNLPYAVPVEQGGPHNRPRRMLARAILRASKQL